MWHTTFISLHAATGAIAFVAGLRALPAGRYFAVYRWSLIAMLAFLLGAIAVTVPSLDGGTLLIFGALVALAAVMVGRSERAARMLPQGSAGPPAGYVQHVGFGLVGLFDAFWVVTLLRVGLPGGVVTGVAVAIAATGHMLIRRRVTQGAGPHGSLEAAVR